MRADAAYELLTSSEPRVASLTLDLSDRLSVGISTHSLPTEVLEEIRRKRDAGVSLHPLLRVSVVQPLASTDEALPDVAGHCELSENGVRFVPQFPFDPGIAYRVTLDPGHSGSAENMEVQTLEFSLPKASGEAPIVEHIYPSADCLPENVLRFYVNFSNPMRRGLVEAQIALFHKGAAAPDVLYRAPVELWDRSMKCLTILFDPGRLKRGVGPNRELGPPLRVGEEYTLVIGSGMSDIGGNKLGESVCKRFRVTEAIRVPITIRSWKFVAPSLGSREPMAIKFPRPLDWALLPDAIRVTKNQSVLNGRIVIGDDETRWSFEPASPWTTGSYEVEVAAELEDVCGNDVTGAFDRPLGSIPTHRSSRHDSCMTFHLG